MFFAATIWVKMPVLRAPARALGLTFAPHTPDELPLCENFQGNLHGALHIRLDKSSAAVVVITEELAYGFLLNQTAAVAGRCGKIGYRRIVSDVDKKQS